VAQALEEGVEIPVWQVQIQRKLDVEAAAQVVKIL
jgi:hypothetical protein